MQTTINRVVSVSGRGLHLGRQVTMRLCPAAAGTGIVFERSDVDGRRARVAARWDQVVQMPLNTRIENCHGTAISTIEHLMAACAGAGLHNLLVEIDGPEVPVMDGSAAPFLRRIEAAGLRELDAPLYAVRVLRPVRVARGDAWAQLSPDAGLRIDFEIEFSDSAIGRQRFALNLAGEAFARELANCRTFCREADVHAMRAQGMALGGTFENAVVVSGARVLTPGGLRRHDEAVRHKMLDALGDLYTAGAPVLGCYIGHRAGHAVTNALLRELFSHRDNWALVEVDAAHAVRLPGNLADADAIGAVA